jgi:putative FmdB family regulatory protein
MAAYDYRCHDCGNVFEVQRPMSAAADPTGLRCPDGHADVTRVWSAVALATGAAGGMAAPAPRAGAPAGGCCGGACGCG